MVYFGVRLRNASYRVQCFIKPFFVFSLMRRYYLLIFLLPLAFSFSVADYLFDNESLSDVSYENFTFNGSAYSIVYLDNRPILVLDREKEEVLTDNESILAVVETHLNSKYAPSPQDVEELKAIIQRFNESRNDGYTWKGKEEYACRNDVLFSGGKVSIGGEPVTCIDDDSCYRNALLLMSAYGEGLGWSDINPILSALKDFSLSSFQMDWILNNYTEKLNSMTSDNAPEVLNYILDNVDTLRENSEKIETTVFRTPRHDDDADKEACMFVCYSVCPSFDLDQGALDDLEAKAQEMLDRLGPLSDLDSYEETLLKENWRRLNYRQNEDAARLYSSRFSSLSANSEQLLQKLEKATSLVDNGILKRKYNEFRALHLSIPARIEERNFSNIEQDLENYQALKGELSSLSESALSAYYKARDSRNYALFIITTLDSRVLDSVAKSSLNDLKTRLSDLNEQFKPGLSEAEWLELADAYSEVAKEGEALLNSQTTQPQMLLVSFLENAAVNLNKGGAQLGKTANLDETTSLNLLFILLALSVFSLVVLVFLHFFSSFSFSIPKAFHIFFSWFLVFSFALFLFFSLLYLFAFNQPADLSIFLESIEKKDEVVIALKLSDMPVAQKELVKECANELVEESSKNISVLAIEEGCSLITDKGSTPLSSAECSSLAQRSDIIVAYREDSATLFSADPPRAYMYGDAEYFESCPMKVFVG